MFNKWKTINKIREDLDHNVSVTKRLSEKLDGIASAVANMRGIINRKLYSGKMKEEMPDWLESNLAFVGITKDKKESQSIL